MSAHIPFHEAHRVEAEDILYAEELALLFYGLGALEPVMYARLESTLVELPGTLLLVDRKG